MKFEVSVDAILKALSKVSNYIAAAVLLKCGGLCQQLPLYIATLQGDALMSLQTSGILKKVKVKDP